MKGTDTHRAIEAVWRIESAKIVGSLTRMVRDVGVADELAQDALVSPRSSSGRPRAFRTTRAPG